MKKCPMRFGVFKYGSNLCLLHPPCERKKFRGYLDGILNDAVTSGI